MKLSPASRNGPTNFKYICCRGDADASVQDTGLIYIPFRTLLTKSGGAETTWRRSAHQMEMGSKVFVRRVLN